MEKYRYNIKSAAAISTSLYELIDSPSLTNLGWKCVFRTFIKK